MTRAEKKDRIRTAYHEAGHAIIAYILGFVPYRATIKAGVNENGPYRGEVRTKLPEWVFLIPDSMARYMIYTLAGIAAQSRFSRHSPNEVDGIDDIRDFDKCWYELFTQTNGRCSVGDDFQIAASGIVKHYWYAIDVFAKALLERETIENEELKDALIAAVFSRCHERFPLWDYIQNGLESIGQHGESLPFEKYSDLVAAASEFADSMYQQSANSES